MIPVSDVRDWLGLPADTARDAIFQRLIDAATGALGRTLGRYLGPVAEVTESYRTTGSRFVLLNDDPTDGVVVRTRMLPTDTWEDGIVADYAVEGRKLRHGSRWPGFVEVTYSRGYAVGAGPAEFRDLVLRMVVGRWQSRGLNETMQSESIGDYSYTRADVEKTSGWEAIARRWRRQMV